MRVIQIAADILTSMPRSLSVVSCTYAGRFLGGFVLELNVHWVSEGHTISQKTSPHHSQFVLNLETNMTHSNHVTSRANSHWLHSLAMLAASMVLFECSNSDSGGGAIGGSTSGTGGSHTTGGLTGAGGTQATGGSNATGGGIQATGGTLATGGSGASTGGSTASTGGNSSGLGGAPAGGTSTVGGTSSGMGGANTGGVPISGGATSAGGTTSVDAGQVTDAGSLPDGGEPTFADVYAIISSRCLGCHVPGGPGVNFGHLDMSTKELAYTDLLGPNGTGAPAAGTSAGASGATCASIQGLLRVDPGNATSSLLWLKVNSKLQAVTTSASEPPCGSGMPVGATNAPLTQEQIDTIAAWIDADAPNN